MKKTTITVNPDKIERKWYLVDANGKTLGRMCTSIAIKLRGKDKTIFSPHLDLGDFVVVINAAKVKYTGTKADKKVYYRHSKYPGGLISEKAKDLIARKPERAIELAIEGMLPKNNLRKLFIKRLKIYGGEDHPHKAQNPQPLEV